MKLPFRLYILAFVCIGFNIPETECVNPMRMIQKKFFPRRPRVRTRRPAPALFEPIHSASASLYRYGDYNYPIPEIETQEIKYYSNSYNYNRGRYVRPQYPTGALGPRRPWRPFGHRKPHKLRKLNKPKFPKPDPISLGSVLIGNFNPAVTTLRHVNPPPTNQYLKNIGGQFNLINPQIVSYVPQQPYIPTFPKITNYAPPQQQFSNYGGFVSSPPPLQQGRIPAGNFPTATPSGQGQPVDFSGGFGTIDSTLRQSIPDFSKVQPVNTNTLTELTPPPLPQTNLFSTGNIYQNSSNPLIEIGKPAPPGYRIEENFQQSFLVSLIPELFERRKRGALNNGQVTSYQYFNRVPNYQTPSQSFSNYAIPVQPVQHSAPIQANLNNYKVQVQPVQNSVPVQANVNTYQVPVQPVQHSVPVQANLNTYKVPVQPVQHSVPVQANLNTYQVPVQPIKYLSPIIQTSYNSFEVPIRAKTQEVPVQISSTSYPIPNIYSETTLKTVPKVYGAPNKRKGEKQGSIITKSKILFSPRLLAHRSMPFRVNKAVPVAKTPSSGFSPLNATIDLLSNVARLTNENSQNSAISNKKTLVVVHVQSFSVLKPPGNDTDLIEGQKNVGFGAHDFQFGGTEALLNVFENLLKTGDPAGETVKTGYGDSQINGIDPMDGILNMIDATDKIHTWAHNRGEQDAGNRFQSFPREAYSDAIPFIDTAPITKTISAAIF